MEPTDTDILVLPLAQALLTAASVLALVTVVVLVRRNHLELRYSLLWLLACCAGVGAAVYPESSRIAAHAMGVRFPFNAVFLLVMAFQLAVTFMLTLAASRSRRDRARLAYELARLRLELEELRARDAASATRAATASGSGAPSAG